MIADCDLEDLGRKGYKMYQLREGFKFGTDTVLLSWFASSFIRKSLKNGNKAARMLELGSNCGAASILCLARIDTAIVDSVEIMKAPYEVMLENIKLNSLEDRWRAYEGDVRDLPSEVKNTQYDVVFMNPPFFKREDGVAASDVNMLRLAGRFEENGGLNDFIAAASSRVVPTSGYVVMVMHGDRLTESMRLLEANGLTPTHLMNVHPMSDKNASMFLIAARKGCKVKSLKILPPLIINCRDDNGDIINTEMITNIYNKEHETCFI